MAWRSSGASNAALIENMAANGLIHSDRVKNAMLSVDRAHYAPTFPYHDSPQPLTHAATISAPHMHASATESLLPHLGPGARVLDIGSGSGYLTHVLAALVQPGGRVVGMEHIAALRELGEGNARKSAAGRGLVDGGGMGFVVGDGRRGWRELGGEGGEWDAIHVGAAAKGGDSLEPLVEQLRAPGRLFVPVEEGGVQHIYVIDKKEDGTVTRRKEYGVRYVPLTDAPD